MARERTRNPEPDISPVLPVGLLLQVLAHGSALFACLPGFLILLVRLETPQGPGLDSIVAGLTLVLIGAVILSLVLNLVAAAHMTLAANPVRARPFGLAILVVVFLQGQGILGLVREFGVFQRMLMLGGPPNAWGAGGLLGPLFAWTTVALGLLEVLRLCLLGWYLRAAEVPGRKSGARLLAWLTPVLLLSPWLLVLTATVLATLAGSPLEPAFAAPLSGCLVLLVGITPLIVYVWSMLVLTRLRSQWLRSSYQ
jgi:hypothetical protein